MKRSRLRELAAIRRRFGYRRLHVLLDREGLRLNHKKLSGSTARNGCRFAGAAAANGPSARVRLWRWRRGRTSAGRWTSCRTR